MVRFGRAPGMRNMATFGMMDENRHAQLQLYFPHSYCAKDRQFDWAHKAYHTNEWGAIAARHAFDDLFLSRSATDIAVMLTFAFETGFTNMQFLGLAADAAEAGDFTFSSLISSIQTDESRHAQIGGPALQLLIANGRKEEAQKLVDVAIARAWRLFCLLTGTAMDYATPLAASQAVVQGVHARVDRRPVRAHADRPGAGPALVLGPDDQRVRLPASRLPDGHLVLAAHAVVERGRGRHARLP